MKRTGTSEGGSAMNWRRGIVPIAIAALVAEMVPANAVGQAGPFLVKKGARAVSGASGLPSLPEQVDLAGIEARTRAHEERLAREGRVPLDGEGGQPLRSLLAEARGAVERGSEADLTMAADRVARAGDLLQRQARTLERHLDALERSIERSPSAPLLKERIRVQREALRTRVAGTVEELEASREGIEDRNSGFFGRLRDSIRWIFNSDPGSRLEELESRMKVWGSARPPQTLGAVASNEGLSYIEWPSGAARMPTGEIVPAYASGSPLQLEDLSKDQEAEASDALIAKASELRTASAIASFVRNEMRLEWYSGCLKGAVETLREGGGNDADLAALTVALLRAQEIPARYVHGTIELPLGKVADLMGLLDAASLEAYYAAPSSWMAPAAIRDAAVRILQAAGIPFEPLVTGGRVNGFRLSHVWVEAYVAFGDYRGAGRGTGERQWVPIEPSISGGPKYEARPAALDVAAALPGGVDGLIDAFLATPGPGSPLDLLKARATEFAAGRGLTYADLQRRVVVRHEVLPFLPGALPFKVVAVHGEYSVLPEGMKHSARIRVQDDMGVALDVSLPLHRLVGQRSVLIYLPATEVDADLIASSGGYWDAPAALVEVKAAVRVKGAVVGEASRAAGLGASQTWTIDVTDPNGAVRRVSNPVIAGNLVAMGFGGRRNGYVEGELYLEGDDDGPAPRFDYAQAAAYANGWADAEEELAGLFNVVRVHPTANVTLYQSQLQVEEVLGVRQRVNWKGLAIDADLRPMAPVELSPGAARQLFRISGYQGSWQEQRTLSEGLGGVASISTVTLLQQAAVQGVPVVEITPANGAQIVPTLEVGAEVRREIFDHLARGRTVRVPARTLTVEDWTGDGFISADPKSGEAGYFLSGALSGGMTVLSTMRWFQEAQAAVQAHSYLSAGQALDWAQTGGLAQDKISNIVVVTPSSSSISVDQLAPIPVTVAVIAQWAVLVSGEKKHYAAFIKNAPVSFFPFDGARPAIAVADATLKEMLANSPAETAARIHAAAVSEVTAIVRDTDPDGRARVFVLPDPIVGAGSTGVLFRPGEGIPGSLNGLNSIMAQVVGARPHASEGYVPVYTLRLREPLLVSVRPGAAASVRPEQAADLDGAVGGIEFGTPLVVSVVDKFGNRLGKQSLVWNDGNAGGRFVDVVEATKAGADLARRGALLLDPTSSYQKNPLTQATVALESTVVTYIPPMVTGAVDVTVAATSGTFVAKFHVKGPFGEKYYNALSGYRTRTWSGITNTYFRSPVVATVFRNEGGRWTPITDKSVGVRSVVVSAVTSPVGEVAVLPEVLATDGVGLKFADNGEVTIRPKYLVPSGTQVSMVTTEVVDDTGKRVCCDRKWNVYATARKVKLDFERIDSGLRTVGLPSVAVGEAQGFALTVARVTDRYLRVWVENPSDGPVFLKPIDGSRILMTSSDPTGYGASAGSFPGMMTLPPGRTHIDFPLDRGSAADLGLSPSGHVYFDVLAKNTQREPSVTPASLDFNPVYGSVSHSMPAAASLHGEPDVQFVGGWRCEYNIADHRLSCTDPSGRVDPLVPAANATYSGQVSASCSNNECASCLSDNGPIPVGAYEIGQGYLDPNRPMMSYSLTAREMLCDSFNGSKPSRKDFLIHYGTPTESGTGVWSGGCIVVTETNMRDRLNELGGGTLQVVPGGALDTCPIANLGWNYTGGTAAQPCLGLRRPPPLEE